MKKPSRRWLLAATTQAIAAAPALIGSQAIAGSKLTPARAPVIDRQAGAAETRTVTGPGRQAAAADTTAATGLGRTSGLLPRSNLVLESALQVDLSKETVRLPLYPGKANGQTVWYILVDASEAVREARLVRDRVGRCSANWRSQRERNNRCT